MYHNLIYNTFNIPYHVSQRIIKMTKSIEISIHDKNMYTLMKLYNVSYKATEDRNDIFIKGVMSEYLTIRIINYMTELTLTCGITLLSIKSLCIAPSVLCIILRSLSIFCIHQLNIDNIICEREIGTIHFAPIIFICNCDQCFMLFVIQYTSILLCTCIYIPFTKHDAKPQCIYISFGIVILIIMIYVYNMLSYICTHIFKKNCR